MPTRRARWWIGWALAVAATSGVLMLVAAPPFVSESIRGVIMTAFSGVCHQLPARSPHVAGISLAVCDRCLGIYGALAAASVVYPVGSGWQERLRTYAKYLIAGAVLVPGIDWAGDVVGIWVNTPPSRLLTGAAFGAIAGFLLTAALIDLLSEKDSRNASDTAGAAC